MKPDNNIYKIGMILFVLLVVSGFTVANLGQPVSQTSSESTDSVSAIYINFGIYLTLTGQDQGEIQGDAAQAGREDSILVLAYFHEITSPRDATTGLPTGKRQHKPLSIVKEFDKSTPKLHNLLTMNEAITEWKLEFYGSSSSDKTSEVLFYTIELTNAHVVRIRASGDLTQGTETIAFVYEKITWTWTEGGFEATDDWETPTIPTSAS